MKPVVPSTEFPVTISASPDVNSPGNLDAINMLPLDSDNDCPELTFILPPVESTE